MSDIASESLGSGDTSGLNMGSRIFFVSSRASGPGLFTPPSWLYRFQSSKKRGNLSLGGSQAVKLTSISSVFSFIRESKLVLHPHSCM